LTTFSGAQISGDFNYSDPTLTIPKNVSEQLGTLSSVGSIDSRLILYEHMHEISNFTIPPGGKETPVGDSREGDSLVIGLDPQKIGDDLSIKGRALSGNRTWDAIIGDSISQSMYYPHPSRYIVLSDPLVESKRFQNTTFHIVGICVDPINNGLVTYVPL